MSYDAGELVALEAELIVACEYAKVCIENVTVQAAFLPPEETPC